jgi:hypothetical protein
LHQIFGVIVDAKCMVSYLSQNSLMRSLVLLVYFGPDQPLLMFTGESFFRHSVNTGFCRNENGQMTRELVPHVPKGAKEQFQGFLNRVRDGHWPSRENSYEVYGPSLSHTDRLETLPPTAWERLSLDD